MKLLHDKKYRAFIDRRTIIGDDDGYILVIYGKCVSVAIKNYVMGRQAFDYFYGNTPFFDMTEMIQYRL